MNFCNFSILTQFFEFNSKSEKFSVGFFFHKVRCFFFSFSESLELGHVLFLGHKRFYLCEKIKKITDDSKSSLSMKSSLFSVGLDIGLYFFSFFFFNYANKQDVSFYYFFYFQLYNLLEYHLLAFFFFNYHYTISTL